MGSSSWIGSRLDGLGRIEVWIHCRRGSCCWMAMGSLYKMNDLEMIIMNRNKIKPKNSPSKISFSNTPKNPNVWLLDAGLHTQNMKMKDGEWDMDFVTRFLIRFLDGCENRAGQEYKYFFLDHEPGTDYISVRGVS
jgi:hypothetical protein